MFKKLIYMLFALLIYSSCDQIADGNYLENPGKDTSNVDTNDIDTAGINFNQGVMIEDFTGHLCGNCPYGTETLNYIDSLFLNPDRIFILAVHAGYYAQVSKDWPQDFRTTEGAEIAKKLKVTSNPITAINRTSYGGTVLQYQQNWEPAVREQIKTRKPFIGMKIEPTYNAANRTITAKVTLMYREASKPSHYLAVYIKEDGVVGKQKDDRKTPNVIENYTFNHIFRGSMNGLWGDQISASPLELNKPIVKTVSFTIPEGKDWKPENLTIMAYVHDFAETDEVLQVNEAELEVK